MTYKFTNRAKKAIEIANECAIELYVLPFFFFNLIISSLLFTGPISAL